MQPIDARERSYGSVKVADGTLSEFPCRAVERLDLGDPFGRPMPQRSGGEDAFLRSLPIHHENGSFVESTPKKGTGSVVEMMPASGRRTVFDLSEEVVFCP